LINSRNNGTRYCKQQLSEWIGEEAEQKEQAALMYGIDSAVETRLYGTQTCNSSATRMEMTMQLGLSGPENNIQAGLVLHAVAFTRLENFHHFSNLHIIFSLT
jgi:hypothetical protein